MPVPKKLIAGVAVALALVTGSAAYAAIPDAGNVIHGCYDKNSGRLRVTDTATNKPKACTKKEGTLDWNTAGADARGVAQDHEFKNGNAGLNGVQVVASVSNLQGAYTFTAKVHIIAASHQWVWCSLDTNVGQVDYDQGIIDGMVGKTDGDNLTLVGAANATMAKLACSASAASIGHIALVATPVASIAP